MLQELFKTNLFLSSSCQVHSENGFGKLYNIFSMKHMFLVLHTCGAVLVKSAGWSVFEILKCSSHKQTVLLKPGNSSFVLVLARTNLTYSSFTLRNSVEISHADGYQNVDFSERFPSSNNCTRRRNRKRFCDVLTLVWRLFPVRPERHRHCSCSQNWHHSPARVQKAEVRLWGKEVKDVLTT